MSPRKDQFARIEEQWRERLANYMVQGHLGKALHYLARIIEAPPSLFDELFAEERRIAWLLRIDLLLQNKRYHEALAWVLYERDINPESAAAAALRLKLRRYLKLEAPSGEAKKSSLETNFDWPGVAGMRALKAMLERDVLLPLWDPALFAKYKLSPPNGILFYGPPGCGKTHIARALADGAFGRFVEATKRGGPEWRDETKVQDCDGLPKEVSTTLPGPNVAAAASARLAQQTAKRLKKSSGSGSTSGVGKPAQLIQLKSS